MKIIIELSTDNAAFEDYYDELDRVLSEIVNRIVRGRLEGTIRDYNGNTVGSFEVTE